MSSDIALVYDPMARHCDLVFNGVDFVLDATPITPMLVGLGTDRRANSDDELPASGGAFATPTTLSARRGTVLDACDPNGDFMGSRLWLLINAKHTEETRQRAEDYAAEPLERLEAELSVAITLDVRWTARNLLRLKASAGASTLTIPVGTG